MSVSPARAAAFDILLRVEQEDAYASELLHSSRYSKLSLLDHALATELVMGVLRWRSALDAAIAQFAAQPVEKLDPEVLTAVRLGAYQLRRLDRVPARAAIHESVELVKRARKRSAASFVNAVLRKLPAGANRQITDLAVPAHAVDTASKLAEVFSHPRWLAERWVREFGVETARKICAFNQSVPETAIRLRASGADAGLLGEGITLTPGLLLASAHRVRSGDVAKTRAFAASRVAIQDEASQLVALLVGQGANILDCCAAPGGKTAALADRNPDATIVACELHPHRARLLRRLVPASHVRVLAADTRVLPLAGQFDRVLVDVPCSGTGTLARNPEIKWRLKLEDLADLQGRQLAILRSAMERVAAAGRLVYSTCSLEREENEEVVEKALAADHSFRRLACRTELERLADQGELVWEDLDSLLSGPYLRTLPGVHPCDGFFAAILEKTWPRRHGEGIQKSDFRMRK